MPSLGTVAGLVGPVGGKGRKMFNAATGGTITTVTNYNGTGKIFRVHTFTANGTFTPTAVGNSFRILTVGSGGGGNGGGGGEVKDQSIPLPIGNNTVVIGPSQGATGAGVSSSVGTVSSSGGPRASNGGFRGGAGQNGPVSNISGTPTYYGGGGGGEQPYSCAGGLGGGGSTANNGANGLGGGGGGRFIDSEGWGISAAGNGGSGLVIIAYEVAA